MIYLTRERLKPNKVRVKIENLCIKNIMYKNTTALSNCRDLVTTYSNMAYTFI